jgi:hypothetical protein
MHHHPQTPFNCILVDFTLLKRVKDAYPRGYILMFCSNFTDISLCKWRAERQFRAFDPLHFSSVFAKLS